MSVIKRLTPEQLELIPVYRQKWREIASNSVGANQSQVQAAIPILYRAIGLPSPKVQFFQGPEPFYQAFESYRFRLAPNSLEDYERAIRRVATNALMLVMMVIMLCWMWSVVLLLTQFPSGFWGVILASLLWRYSPLQSVLKSQPKLARRVNTFIGLGFLAWFFISPLVCAWVVRKNIALAWGLGILIAVALLIWLTTVLERRLLQSRWKQIIAASIRDQLSRKVRQELAQIWAVDSLLPPSANANPSGYFSSLKWSYSQFPKQPSDCLKTLDWLEWCSYIDFCISELGCSCDRSLWEALQTVIQECGLVLPLQRFCWVCDRPKRIALDAQGRLHGEGEAAIAFGDGSCIYAYQGVKLPPEYGKLHPHQWKAESVLSEQNAEVRRALIQGIGYSRLCQELGAQTLDTWREYTLLQIDLPTRLQVNGQEVEEESVLLLKMTCPSTQHIHVLRVPPRMRSARAAVKWVNWDTDPSEFSIET